MSRNCATCRAYLHDTLESSFKQVHPRLTLLITEATVDFYRALVMCLANPDVYKQIRETLETMVTFHGQEMAEEALLGHVTVLRGTIEHFAILCAEITSKEYSVTRAWLRALSYSLFMNFWSIHGMHTGVIPFQDPVVKPKQARVCKTVVGDDVAQEALEEDDPLYS